MGTELLGNLDRAGGPNKLLLAICIPTYNRRAVLEECLASVLPQADASGVGVLISDNGSSDGTWQTLERLKAQYPWMQIMRHTRNIGYRDNLIGAVLSSHAQYVWPIGDKMSLLPGAVPFVVDELTRLHPDAVVVNTTFRVVSTVEKLYMAPQPYLIDMGWRTTLLGATVLPRQAWVDVLHVQPLSRDFIQVAAIFSYLASLCAPRALFSGRVLIEVGTGAIQNNVPSTWANSVLKTFGRNWYDVVMDLPVLYSPEVKLQVVRNHSEMTDILGLRNLMRLRAQGQLTRQRLVADEEPLRAAVSTPWWCAMLISVLPRWMIWPLMYFHPRRLVRAVLRRLGLSYRHQVC